MSRLGRITDNSIASIRDQVPIEQVVSEYVTLKRAGGGSLKGLCPFHDEKGPSFHVTPDRGVYHCFGCQEGGDVISFVQKIEGLDFISTVEQLSERFGITVERDDNDTNPRARSNNSSSQHLDPATRANLIAANKAAAEYYAQMLKTSDAILAQKFLHERGFTPEHAEQFTLGYAPDAWDHLTKHLTSKGFKNEDLLLAGLVSKTERGSLIDRSRLRRLICAALNELVRSPRPNGSGSTTPSRTLSTMYRMSLSIACRCGPSGSSSRFAQRFRTWAYTRLRSAAP